MSKEAAQAHLDTYLAQVHRHLKGLPDAEVRETLAELRSHVLDKLEGEMSVGRIEAAIAELGSPRDVARVNVTERVAADLETNRSPWRVLRAVGRLASLSVYGLFAFLVSFTGYAAAAAFLVTAAVKPFAWNHAGLWVEQGGPETYSWSWRHLGIGDGSHNGHELLGFLDHPHPGTAAGLSCWAGSPGASASSASASWAAGQESRAEILPHRGRWPRGPGGGVPPRALQLKPLSRSATAPPCGEHLGAPGRGRDGCGSHDRAPDSQVLAPTATTRPTPPHPGRWRACPSP